MEGKEGLTPSEIMAELDKKFEESLKDKTTKSVDTKKQSEKKEESFEDKKTRLEELENELAVS